MIFNSHQLINCQTHSNSWQLHKSMIKASDLIKRLGGWLWCLFIQHCCMSIQHCPFMSRSVWPIQHSRCLWSTHTKYNKGCYSRNERHFAQAVQTFACVKDVEVVLGIWMASAPPFWLLHCPSRTWDSSGTLITPVRNVWLTMVESIL